MANPVPDSAQDLEKETRKRKFTNPLNGSTMRKKIPLSGGVSYGEELVKKKLQLWGLKDA